MIMAPNRKAAIAPPWSKEEGFDWQRIPAVVLSAGSAIESAGSRQEIVDNVAGLIQYLVGLSYGVMGAAVDEPAIRALGLLSAQVDMGFSRILMKEKDRPFDPLLRIGRGGRNEQGSRNEHGVRNEQVGRHEQGSRNEQGGRHEQGALVGSGPAMKAVYRLVAAVAPSPSTVLIFGETGTGKELIARAIHEQSPRKGKAMVKVNCAALPAELIESELFGHERGSFTGATERRIGKFEQADGGTLFLDEIGEMPVGLQVRLLRALQEREIERIGGKGHIKVDVRVIAATNRDLKIEMTEGRFRPDLFYRLNIFPITLPPLRSRVEDIPALAACFVERYAKQAGRAVYGISHSLLEEMKQYAWPGNVRELENLIERSVLLTTTEVIRDLPLPGRKGAASAGAGVVSSAGVGAVSSAVAGSAGAGPGVVAASGSTGSGAVAASGWPASGAVAGAEAGGVAGSPGGVAGPSGFGLEQGGMTGSGPGSVTGAGFEEEPPEFKTIDDMERDHIAATLEHCRWRVGGSKGAANLLGVPPSTLFSKMKKLNIVRKYDPG